MHEDPSLSPDDRVEPQIIGFGPFRFDPHGLRLSRGTETLPIQPKALALLRCLLDAPGKIVLKDELLERVWHDSVVTDKSVAEAVRMLRQVLQDGPQKPTYIETIHGRGYRFMAPTIRLAGTPINGEPEIAVLGATHPAPVDASDTPAPRWPRVAISKSVVLAATAATVLLGVSLVMFLFDPPVDQGITTPPIRFSVSFPEGQGFGMFDLSPDGHRIVYDRGITDPTIDPAATNPETGLPTAQYPLFIRELESFEATPIPGTEGGQFPVFSPDGERVAFYLQEPQHRATLRTVALDGSYGRQIASLFWWNWGSPTWGADGYIYYFGRPTEDDPAGIYRTPEDGGAPQQLTVADPSREKSHGFLQLLPGDAGLLYTVQPISAVKAEWDVLVLSLTTGQRRVIPGVSGRVRYLPTGHLLYARAGAVWARRLSLDTLEFEGPEIAIEVPASRRTLPGPRPLAISPTGTLVYRVDGVNVTGTLARVDLEGNRETLPLARVSSECPSLDIALDGVSIAAICRGDATIGEDTFLDLYVGDLERGTMERRTFDGRARWARWHPDSQRIAYSTYSDEGWSIRSIIADRRGASTVLVHSQYRLSPESFSPDGRWLVYQEQHPETGEDLWLVAADGGGPPQPLLVREAHDSGAEISPDGQWLAYHSNIDGAWHVYVTPFPGPGTATKVSTRDGGWPQWKPDRTELFYMSSAGRAIFAMSVSDTGDFGQPRQLFETGGGYRRTRAVAVFRFAPDGESIVVALWERQPASLRVAVNWLDELLASFENADS